MLSSKYITWLQQIILSNIMSHSRSNNKKNSHSSIKLPRLDNRLVSPAHSKQKIKMRDVSLDLIYLSPQDTHENYQAHKSMNKRYQKQKSKSRAEPMRLRTQAVQHEVNSKVSIQNSYSVEDLDNTLNNFKRNVQQNRQKLQNLRGWKSGGNKSSLASIKTAEETVTKKRSLIRSEFSNDVNIFQKLNKILTNNKTVSTEIDLGQVQKTLKYAEIAKKIQKFNTQNCSGNPSGVLKLEVQMRSEQKVEYKNQNNYSQWRRLDICSGQKSPRYQTSTFDNENERLKNLVLKTEASLSKYWQNKRLFSQIKSQENVKK